MRFRTTLGAKWQYDHWARLDEKWAAMEKWSGWLERVLTSDEVDLGAKVVPLCRSGQVA